MIVIAIVLFIFILVVATGYIFYKRGYDDGVAAGEWESVLARAEKANAKAVNQGTNL